MTTKSKKKKSIELSAELKARIVEFANDDNSNPKEILTFVSDNLERIPPAVAAKLRRYAKVRDKQIVEYKKLKQLEREQLKVEQDNKLLYFGKEGKGYLGKNGTWAPNPIQNKYFSALRDPEKRIFCLTGANRISKTFSTTGVTALLAIRGHFPWEDPDIVGRWFWDLHGWANPIKVRIMGQDWEKHVKTVLTSTINELWPKSWDLKPSKNNVGVDAIYTDKFTGSKVEILSNNSDPDTSEGWHGHVVIYDEPPRREHRVACARGLVDHRGIEIFAMTLLKEDWIDQEVMNRRLEDGRLDPDVFSIVGDIQSNVGFGITQDGVDAFAKTLTDNEKKARLRGVPSYKQGLLLEIDTNVHIKEAIKNIPKTWLVQVAVDVGLSKPHDIMYMAIDEHNVRYVIHTAQVEGNGKVIGESILFTQKKTGWRLHPEIICDPYAKAGVEYENSTWNLLDEVIGQVGMGLVVGQKAPEDGVLAINGLLNPSNTANPLLYFFDRCTLAIQQCMNWKQEINERTGTVKISKKNDDCCENLYRLILDNLEWYPINAKSSESDSSDEFNFNDRDPITGY